MLNERIRALQTLLQDEDEDVRSAAAEAMDKVEAVMSLDRVLASLKSDNREHRAKAILALEKIQSKDVYPPLIKILSE